MIEHMSQNMTKTSKKALFQPYNEVKISSFQDIQDRRGNRLPERFAAWQERRPFVIGETGVGTGLNMLCAWACFDS